MGDVQREVRELLDTPAANGEAAAVSTPGSQPPAGPEAGPAPEPADPPTVSGGDHPAAGAARAAAQGHGAERGALEPGQVSAAASAAAPAQQPSSSSAGRQGSSALQHSGRGAPQAPGAAGGGRWNALGAVQLGFPLLEHSGGGSSGSEGPAADSLASDSDESEGSIIGFDTEALAPAERCAAAAAGELVDAARAAVRPRKMAEGALSLRSSCSSSWQADGHACSLSSCCVGVSCPPHNSASKGSVMSCVQLDVWAR